MDNAPSLNLVEGLKLGDRDENNDGLLSTTDIDLTGSGDLERTKLVLELGGARLEVKHGLCDASLGLIGGSSGRVRRAEDLVLNGHIRFWEVLLKPCDGTVVRCLLLRDRHPN